MNNRNAYDIFTAALAAADPYRAVLNAIGLAGDELRIGGGSYGLGRFNRLLVVGAGKASAQMARAAEELLGDRISDGLIIVKHGHTAALERIRQIEAGHPVPDEAGMRGTREIIKLLNGLDEQTLVLCLFSGGGSALLVSPVEGITLSDKQAVTNVLLRAGATIQELNAVSKHLSAVKGGRLAETAFPATLITLMLSDVIGDQLDVIASGPTVPDSTSFRDALDVIHKYSLEQKIPGSVFSLLHLGVAGMIPETPKSGAAFFQRTRNTIVGSIQQSLEAALKRAAELGYQSEIIASGLCGEARDAARMLARTALRARDALKPGEQRCLLSGGETVVTVRGNGTGGRNQELALAFALEISGEQGITMLSAGTDGTDGPTDAAGAMVDGDTPGIARSFGLDPAAYLENNDSYTFFRRLDDRSGERYHLKTGPTGTNVMDIQILLIEGKGAA